MSMRFETDFQVPGTPDDVIKRFDDVPLVASFVPGASVGERNPDGSYPGTLTVSFGPKRISFKGTVLNTVDPATCSGVVVGQGNADVRGAKLAVTTKYELLPVEENGRPATRVHVVSEAQLSGMLAEFAATGGVALTNAILADFARRFAAHVGTGGEEPAAQASQSSAPALSGFYLAKEMFKAFVRRLFGRPGS